MILVVGATGMLGGAISRRLRADHVPVRALVRPGPDGAKVNALRAVGVETVAGDLRDPGSLAAACRGVDTVITTVSSMPFSYVAGENDIRTTDRSGTEQLIRAAAAAGVGHFIHTSFSGNLDLESPLRNAKRAVEDTLRGEAMRYTILRPSCFMEVWLSPAVGFDWPNARATVYGTGERPVSYIAVDDVAEFAVMSVTSPAAWNATLELGGPDQVSQLDAVRIFERIGGRPFEVSHVPDEALRAQADAATDDMQRTFPVLMRCVAQGDPIDMTDLRAAMPVALTSVATYAEKVLGRVPAHAV